MDKSFESLTNIEKRRVINQHNMECNHAGVSSELCTTGAIVFDERMSLRIGLFTHQYLKGKLPCNRCDHRNDMLYNPERAYASFDPEVYGDYKL